jgi:hypothetical protein
VGDAAGEPADRLHLLGLPQLGEDALSLLDLPLQRVLLRQHVAQHRLGTLVRLQARPALLFELRLELDELPKRNVSAVGHDRSHGRTAGWTGVTPEIVTHRFAAARPPPGTL